jgi:flagellar motor switch protein FliG
VADEQAEKKTTVKGAEKAGVLLLTLGEDVAAEILQHMNPREVQMVGSTMAMMNDVSRPTVEYVIDDFFDTLESQTSLGIGNDAYIRSMLQKALGDKAGSVIDRILMGSGSNGLDSLKWMDPKSIAEIIRLEHPQIIAIVLSYLDADNAAQVLSASPRWKACSRRRSRNSIRSWRSISATVKTSSRRWSAAKKPPPAF